MPCGIRYKTVSASLLHAFMRQIVSSGMSEADFLLQTGITAADLNASDGRLSGDKHLRILSLYESLPVQLDRLPSSLDTFYQQFPELSALWANAYSARQGVASYVENRCLLGEVDFVRVHSQPDQLQLDYINEAGLGRTSASALGNFAIVTTILRHLLDGAAADIRLDLQGELAVDVALLEVRLGARVRFGQPANQLRCHSGALDTPFRLHNPLAERLRLGQRRSFMHQVAALLESHLRTLAGNGSSDDALAAVCSHFGISRWTLLRRLKEEDCTFSALWTRIRAAEARRLVLESAEALGEISDRLGFGSQSSLSRFFRSQWGMSPQDFRARLGQPSAQPQPLA
jgi:AraC-like DNA-binding protein